MGVKEARDEGGTVTLLEKKEYESFERECRPDGEGDRLEGQFVGFHCRILAERVYI